MNREEDLSSEEQTESGGDDRIEVAIIDRTVYLKPVGFATQRNSLGIPDFLNAMFRAGCSSVAFDLCECRGMDSTFLGVIATAATARQRKPGKSVVVLNAQEHLIRQLRRIGLLPLLCVHEAPVKAPAELKLHQVDFVHFPKTEYQKLQTVKRLHEQLIQLNERNKQLFGPFVGMLEEELRAQRDAAGQ